jgi:hypothetical protein
MTINEIAEQLLRMHMWVRCCDKKNCESQLGKPHLPDLANLARQQESGLKTVPHSLTALLIKEHYKKTKSRTMQMWL